MTAPTQALTPAVVLTAALIGLAPVPAHSASAYFVHTDLDGSVAMETDSCGNVVYERTYEPYGLPRAPVEDRPGYTGHVHDSQSGLVYAQQRYYDPEVGQFLSPDPMAVYPSTAWNFSRYNYAANNPYRYTDPDGREPLTHWPVPDHYRINASGKQVVIDHGDGKFTQSAHLDTVSVAPGDVVQGGDQVGTAGRTENTPAQGDTHVHFEVRVGSPAPQSAGGAVVDPLSQLPTPPQIRERNQP